MDYEIDSRDPRYVIAIDAHAARQDAEMDELCICGHPDRRHDPSDIPGANRRCNGTGAELDVEYGIPADEACACRYFEAQR